MGEGFWLYAGTEPLVHLTACDADDRRAGGAHRPGFFDHVAFSGSGLAGMLKRLRRYGVPYELAEVASLGQVQVFLRDPAGGASSSTSWASAGVRPPRAQTSAAGSAERAVRIPTDGGDS